MSMFANNALLGGGVRVRVWIIKVAITGSFSSSSVNSSSLMACVFTVPCFELQTCHEFFQSASPVGMGFHVP